MYIHSMTKSLATLLALIYCVVVSIYLTISSTTTYFVLIELPRNIVQH